MNDLHFKRLSDHPQGTIFKLLEQCYAGVKKMMPEYCKIWINDWKAYDEEIFQNPDTVGACGFVTYLNNIILGFASWDPRQFPKGIIGHNGILPEFRGNGYGRIQIYEVLKRLKNKNFQKVTTTTMDHPFFGRAQKMYPACGFKETKRFSVEGKDYSLIEYEKLM